MSIAKGTIGHNSADYMTSLQAWSAWLEQDRNNQSWQSRLWAVATEERTRVTFLYSLVCVCVCILHASIKRLFSISLYIHLPCGIVKVVCLCRGFLPLTCTFIIMYLLYVLFQLLATTLYCVNQTVCICVYASRCFDQIFSVPLSFNKCLHGKNTYCV